MRKDQRKCPYCKGLTPKETLNIPDSCYCENCGSYLGDMRNTTLEDQVFKITPDGKRILKELGLEFNPSSRNSTE